MVKVRIDLQAGHAMTEFFTVPIPPNDDAEDDDRGTDIFGRMNSSSSGSTSAPVHGVDADVANWVMEADCHSSFLRFSLVFADAAKIPRNHLR